MRFAPVSAALSAGSVSNVSAVKLPSGSRRMIRTATAPACGCAQAMNCDQGLMSRNGRSCFQASRKLSLVVLLGRERRLLVKERLHADVPEDDRGPDAGAERIGFALGRQVPVAFYEQVHDTADRDRERRAHAHQDPQGATLVRFEPADLTPDPSVELLDPPDERRP